MAMVYHAIHTNAYSQGKEGFRSIVLTPPDWPKPGQEHVEKWLQGLAPQPGQDTAAGVAIDCFRLGELIYACLAMVDPDFALDEHERAGGFLAHGLILPLEAERPCGDFGSALLELRRSFEKPKCDDRDRLDAYLEQCRHNSEVTPKPADLQWILALREEFWSRFFELVSMPRKEAWWPADLSSDFPMDFLRVSALVPPRLRLALRWSFELAAVPKNAVRIRLGSGQQLRAPQKTSLSELYWDWLRSCVNQGEPELVYQLAESWAINSWDDLEREIRVMAKKRAQQKEATLELRGQPAEKSPAGLKDLRAIEKSVKSYVDQRLEGLDPAGVSTGSGWYRRWRTEIWGVPMLLWLGYLTARGGIGTPEPAAPQVVANPTTPPVSKPTADVQTDKAPKPVSPRPVLEPALVSEILANPRDEWRAYIKTHVVKATDLLKSVKAGSELPPGSVTSALEQRFDDLLAGFQKGRGLSQDEIEVSLEGCFEYIIKLSQQRKGKSDLAGKIDAELDANEYAPADVRAFFAEHHVGGVADRVLESRPPSVALQALVVITWLEKEPR